MEARTFKMPVIFTNVLRGVTANFTGWIYAGGLFIRGGVVEGLKTADIMPVLGGWAIDGDAARTNGAGLVGATPTLTEAATAYAKVENNGVFGPLSSANSGYSAAYKLFPTSPVAGEDFCYFGGAVPFCEMALDIATAATFDAAGVLAWTYWNGSAWAALTLAIDNTNSSTKDGSLSFTRDGAIAFIPPASWTAKTVDGQSAYWIRCGIAAGKAANLTAIPSTNSKKHEIVTPAGGYVARQNGIIDRIRLNDAAGTLHTGADVKFILMNYTTGEHSGALTFAQDVRTQVFTGLSLAVHTDDVLGVLVTQEDGTNEPTGCLLELGFTSTEA
jgi:hypothetical protein